MKHADSESVLRFAIQGSFFKLQTDTIQLYIYIDNRLVFLLWFLNTSVILHYSAAAPRWCCQNIEAYRKCAQVAVDTGKIECVMALGEKGCSTMIANGMADLSAFDGGSIYHAGLCL